MLLSKVTNVCLVKKYKYLFSKHILPVTTIANKCHYHITSTRNISAKSTPDLIYFPQIIRWLKTKIGLKLLQKTWDPEFSEGAFIYGSIQAICRITEIINNDDKKDELKNLVTPDLGKRLRSDMKVHLTDLQKKMIVLTPKDIKLLVPTDFRLSNVNNKRICHICLRSLSVKWQDLNGLLRLVIIAIQTDFERNYSEKDKSEWTVNVFDIVECAILGAKKTAAKS